MLDFCEVQHLKLNLSVALVASAEAKLILGVSIREANYWFIFFAPAVSKKRTERMRMQCH